MKVMLRCVVSVLAACGALVVPAPAQATTVDDRFTGTGIVSAGQTVELEIAGRAGIPVDATTVVISLTATGTNAPGFVTVHPCTGPRPNSSHLNFTTAQTIATSVIAPIDANGRVCIYSSATTHLITDVNGWFPAANSYTPITPARLLDTRTEATTADNTGLPPDSGAGRRAVYSKNRMRVWLVEADGGVSRTYRVSGRLGQPLPGTYAVWSKSPITCARKHPDICMRFMVRFAHTFSGDNIGFHEIPERGGRPLQSDDQLGLSLSGGCVRQSTTDALHMWDWAAIGTTVVVTD